MAIKVKQDMIDFIKNQGMAAALKRAGQLKAKGGKGEAEFLEGVKRMYGASRLEAATAKASAGAAKAAPSTRRKYGTPNNTSKPKMVDAKGPNAVGKKAEPSTRRKYGTPNTTSKTAAAKKTGTTDPFAKFVFAQGRALKEPFTSKPKPKK